MVIFAKSAVVFNGLYREHLGTFKPFEYGIKRGFRNFYIGLDVLYDFIAVGILILVRTLQANLFFFFFPYNTSLHTILYHT